MTRFIQALLLGGLSLPLVTSFEARAADLDYRYTPPPPAVRYERTVVIEEPPSVIGERPPAGPRPYLYAYPPTPYGYGRGYRRHLAYRHRYASYPDRYARHAYRPGHYDWYR